MAISGYLQLCGATQWSCIFFIVHNLHGKMVNSDAASPGKRGHLQLHTMLTPAVPSWSRITNEVLRFDLRARDEATTKPQCGSGIKGSYNFPAHVFALFLILTLSTLGKLPFSICHSLADLFQLVAFLSYLDDHRKALLLRDSYSYHNILVQVFLLRPLSSIFFPQLSCHSRTHVCQTFSVYNIVRWLD